MFKIKLLIVRSRTISKTHCSFVPWQFQKFFSGDLELWTIGKIKGSSNSESGAVHLIIGRLCVQLICEDRYSEWNKFHSTQTSILSFFSVFESSAQNWRLFLRYNSSFCTIFPLEDFVKSLYCITDLYFIYLVSKFVHSFNGQYFDQEVSGCQIISPEVAISVTHTNRLFSLGY